MSRDPKGRRALFEGGDGPPPASAADGRRAFYTAEDVAASPGGVTIACSQCGERTSVTWAEAARRVMAFSVWAPWRAHSRWITCPACGERAWCRVRWW